MILRKKEVPTQGKEVKVNDDAPDYITTDNTEPNDDDSVENEEDNLPPLPPIQSRGACP